LSRLLAVSSWIIEPEIMTGISSPPCCERSSRTVDAPLVGRLAIRLHHAARFFDRRIVPQAVLADDFFGAVAEAGTRAVVVIVNDALLSTRMIMSDELSRSVESILIERKHLNYFCLLLKNILARLVRRSSEFRIDTSSLSFSNITSTASRHLISWRLEAVEVRNEFASFFKLDDDHCVRDLGGEAG